MKKVHKTSTNINNKKDLDKRLESYALDSIQKPSVIQNIMQKSTLALITPLAAASLLSSDLRAQMCGGTGSPPAFAANLGDNGVLDVNGDGMPDFGFYISYNYLYITPVGNISLGLNQIQYTSTSNTYTSILTYAGTREPNSEINADGIWSNAYSFGFYYPLDSATTFYVPLKNSDSFLGFIEITFDGNGNFSINLDKTGLANHTNPIIAGSCESLKMPLPITLAEFDVIHRNNINLLSWKTMGEINNRGFEIQKSLDGENFYKIGWKDGSGTIENEINYQFVDKSVNSGANYYRLKQIDYDGSHNYSKIISSNSAKDVGIKIGQIFPNPSISSNFVELEITSDKRTKLNYELLDVLGKTLQSNEQNVEEGKNTLNINTNNLEPGSYFVKLNAFGSTQFRKFVIQK